MISTLCTISSTHNSCEDNLFYKKSGNLIQGMISDGCSTGSNSAFASQSLCYLFNKYSNFQRKIYEDSTILFVKGALESLKILMDVGNESFLATCILFTYDEKSKILWVRFIGDGFYYVNNKEFEVDQNNAPNYLGYHLNSFTHDFRRSFLDKFPILSFTGVDNFAITSDGLKAIMRSPLKEVAKNPEPMDLLLAEPTSENYLKRMWNILKMDGYYLSDDLSIISYGSKY